MIRILLLDIVLYFGQIITLVLTFITGHAGSIPSSSSFPYDDVLLPPEQTRYTPIKGNEKVEAEDDVESGLKQRRRKGFESAFEELDVEERDLWLNDEEGPGRRTGSEFRYMRAVQLRNSSFQRLHQVYVAQVRLPTDDSENHH